MIDFKKRLNSEKNLVITEPCELYRTLDRKSVAGPLRPAQAHILSEWYDNHRLDKDLIIKLHTGEGKTLIGLLLLQSMINMKEGPVLYVCPNVYLAKQVCEEAEKFGIQYCEIGEDNILPDEFTCGEKILITHAHKVFNGKTIFGIGNNYISVGTVILDDSHACIDVIKDSHSVNIRRSDNEAIYTRILSLFKDDLSEQGEGSLLDIESGDYETFMAVPYWSWYDKKTEILKILSENNNNMAIQFAWPLMRDKIVEYSCYISGNEIEIVPYNASIDVFGSFSKAKHRILMSATTQDDAYFVKGLSFDTKAVSEPLMFSEQKWSGEKMIIIPSLINEECDRDLVVTEFSKMSNSKFGMVSLVPNTKKAQQYENIGAVSADRNRIFEIIEKLKKREFEKLIVINNRYDGIDLPDETCRILIFDSLPYFNSLSGKYEKRCRPNSEVINKRIAQKIEQGIGRGVRGEKDYCAILIIGSDLVKFMRSTSTRKYFSFQTQKQIDIGLDIAEMAKEDIDPEDKTIKPIISLIKQMLQRDDGWKEYYVDSMADIVYEKSELDLYDVLLEEATIEKLYASGEYEKAANRMQNFIDKYANQDCYEKGWYLQQLARYLYPIRKDESIKLQKAAFTNNTQLLKPKTGIEYRKVSYINENRMNRIRRILCEYGDYGELCLSIDECLDNLSFGVEAEKFESALKTIGDILGYISQRPDSEIRKGPDNLWCGVNNNYCLFECKSEVDDSRSEISKHEAGQMDSHCAWFEEEYGKDTKVSRFLIIPTKELSYYGNFTHEVHIIRRNKLKKFKDSIKRFIKELAPYNISDISDEKLQEFLNIHKLNMEDMIEEYSENYYHKTK